MPARKRKRFLKRKKSKIALDKRFIYIITLLLLLIIGIFCLMRTRAWNGKDKVSLLVKNSDNSFDIVVFEPILEEIYEINIPGNTQIEVAGNRGVWKVKSLWALGEQEGLDGELAARSITVAMKLPVYEWTDQPGKSLVGGNILSSLNALFSSYKSSLVFGDKLRILLFSSKVKNTKKELINLAQSSFIQKKILTDGEEGYIVNKSLPQNILAIFSESEFSDHVIHVYLKDASEKSGLAEDVGGVIETLGGKISSVEKTDDYDGVCTINVKSNEQLRILEKIFDCDKYNVKSDMSFDVEIALGKKFAEEY